MPPSLSLTLSVCVTLPAVIIGLVLLRYAAEISLQAQFAFGLIELWLQLTANCLILRATSFFLLRLLLLLIRT